MEVRCFTTQQEIEQSNEKKRKEREKERENYKPKIEFLCHPHVQE